MNDWAIEADQLIKKFPRRATPADKTTARGNESQPTPPAPKRSRWPFGRKAEPTAWFTAVDGVSLQIQRGEVFGLLGPNGAGKSTTIRMLCTLLEPTEGTAHVNGYDVVRQSTQVRQSLGTVLAGERSIYWKLSARENLEYFAALYHIPANVAQRRIAELLDRMELTARANDLVEKYSTGMRQRVAIARALLAQPPILLLDEPTLGLDPQAARKVRELVRELKSEGHTILLTTHYMEEADQLSDRIGIIDTGKVIALGTPASQASDRAERRDSFGSGGVARRDGRGAPPTSDGGERHAALYRRRFAVGSEPVGRRQPRGLARHHRARQFQRDARRQSERRAAFAGRCVHSPHRQSAAGLSAMTTVTLTPPDIRQHGLAAEWRALRAVVHREWTIFRRYPSWIIALFIWPIIFPMAYILSSQALAGPNGGGLLIFQRNAGTTDVVGYIAIGTIIWMWQNVVLWNVGFACARSNCAARWKATGCHPRGASRCCWATARCRWWRC